ncbi:MAG: WbqC family protein [Vicinamibacterales bacterium]
MQIAIVQSNYIPWKGYFDLMRSVDEFVLLDDVQYTRRDWRNRNRIKTAGGTAWLTIPVQASGHYRDPIKNIVVSDPHWGARHWRTLVASYARARCFGEFADRFDRLYHQSGATRLSDINRRFIEEVCDILGIRTRLTWSMDYACEGGRTERLIEICRQVGATTYVSGPAARAYINPALFEAAGIGLSYFAYEGYPEYDQLYPPFEHNVTVLDLLFHEGHRALEFMRRN